MNPIEIAFPNLSVTCYRLTSPPDSGYNCLSWAAGENNRWWWPDPLGVSYWPPGVPREESLSAFVAAYATIGFTLAIDDAVETGFEKIAIYARSGVPTHAARQLPEGGWTSKLGDGEDIEHDQTDGISGAI